LTAEAPGQARHGHDVAADHDDELGAGGEAHLAHVHHVFDGAARSAGRVENEYWVFATHTG